MPLPKIIRSRRKTIALIVQADGNLLVRAPQRATNRQISKLVEQKAEWIRARQTQALARPKAEVHQFTSGEHFWYMGRSYPLLVMQGNQDRLEFSGGQFKLSLHAESPLRYSRACKEIAQAVFTEWYRRQARQVLEERVALLARRWGYNYRQVKITSAHTRWGSCSTRGTLSFPWRLVMAPPLVIDYVVIHELVHTVVMGHGQAFWKSVQALIPEYKPYIRWLKENGTMLEV